MKIITINYTNIGILGIVSFAVLYLFLFAQPAETVMKDNPSLKKTMFAGGCFWCMEKPFETLKGVVSVVSGYTGGHTENPDYENYAEGGHIEVIEITYDPKIVSYDALLDVYWRQVDPTDDGGQFVDRGNAYTTAIFYNDDTERVIAEKSKAELEKRRIYGKSIVTPILPAQTFYPAETYHQDYYSKNPIRYKYYRHSSGRDQFLTKIWGEDREHRKWSVSELKRKLTPIQYAVTQEEATEPPFDNTYWDYKKAGIYVDVVSGEPLFSSKEKFDSGSGWPSFTAPLAPENIVEKEDRKLFSVRTEVRSRTGNSHLGHVFDDGPEPTGLRYCINSAALRFIPVSDLEKEGYGEFVPLFNE